MLDVRALTFAVALGSSAVAWAGCTSRIESSRTPSGAAAPPRPAGCPVAIDPSTTLPKGLVELGSVRANCDRDRVPEAECVQALRDEACALGGDHLYWVHDVSKVAHRRILLARAARSSPP